MATFNELKLSEHLLTSLAEMGFEEPTPVQSEAIPHLLEGRDVVAQAFTGTGKTAAFGIPLVERIDSKQNFPQAVVMAPTRELAIQVAEHLSQLGRHTGLRLLPIYGGQPIERQLRALSRGVHAIVATPGRLMDHMRRGSIDLGDVRMLVLDEADQMLQMGFQEDVEYVMSHLPEQRLTALFSATMPKAILDIVHRYMKDPQMLHLSKAHALTVPEVEQTYYVVPFPRKLDALTRVLDARQPDRAMVFVATKRMADEVAEKLQGRGYVAEAIHGDLAQAGRERVLRGFREGRTDVLVATDVAARGLDVTDVSLVVNFDIPPDPEYYVHRIGRTGRVGRGGAALTFVNPREVRELQLIERATGARIQRAELPTATAAQERETEVLEAQILDVLARGTWQPLRGMVEELLTSHDPVEIASAAAALALERSKRQRRVELPHANPRPRLDGPRTDDTGPDWEPQAPRRPQRPRVSTDRPPAARRPFSAARRPDGPPRSDGSPRFGGPPSPGRPKRSGAPRPPAKKQSRRQRRAN